jgi:hypothetical protein
LDQNGYDAIDHISYDYNGEGNQKPNTSVVLRLLRSNGTTLVVANNHTARNVTITIRLVKKSEPVCLSLDPYEGKVVPV